MYDYSINQWILFFFIYSFLGWVWETSYVSIKSFKFVNRGFLKGPLLPIYGFGAITILFATIPVKNKLILVFIFGMIAATILEYITGYVMERIFHVRYWDYSDDAFNINGYICLGCTLVWGVFSVLMVRFINPPIEKVVFMLSKEFIIVVNIFMIIAIGIDIVVSFFEAIDLKEVLSNLNENNNNFKRTKKRLEAISDFIEKNTNDFVMNLSRTNNEMKERIDKNIETNLRLKNDMSKLDEEYSSSKIDLLDCNLDSGHTKMANILKILIQKLTSYEEMLDNDYLVQDDKREKYKKEIHEFKNKIKKQLSHIEDISRKKVNRSVGILNRNPGARTKRYSEALEDIRKNYKRNKK